MWVLVGGGGTSTTPSITTTALAVVVLLPVVLVRQAKTSKNKQQLQKIAKRLQKTIY